MESSTPHDTNNFWVTYNKATHTHRNPKQGPFDEESSLLSGKAGKSPVTKGTRPKPSNWKSWVAGSPKIYLLFIDIGTCKNGEKLPCLPSLRSKSHDSKRGEEELSGGHCHRPKEILRCNRKNQCCRPTIVIYKWSYGAPRNGLING